VARHWVARHGGTLEIESQPGAGARVRVALPLRRRAP
jgi:signal transduction histidine kinase